MPTPCRTTSKTPLVRRTVAAVGVVLLPLLSACGGGSSSTAGDSAGSSPTQTQSSSSSSVTCDYRDAPQGKTGHATKPPSAPTVQGQVHVTIKTTIGDLGATLDADTTPCTVSSFVSLAQQGFFDNSPCHRLTTAESRIYVLQCGDPTGTGTGGPGYTVPDELSGQETYGPGTLAMANTGQPNTGGSQFFMVYKSTPLPASYTVFGHLDGAALQRVQKAARAGTDNAFGPGDGHPKVTVTIDSVTTG